MKRMRRLIGIAIGLLALIGQPALGQPVEPRDTHYPFFGLWTVTQARPAPWTGGVYTADPFLSRAWIGKDVIFEIDGIDAPFPLGCDDPAYRTIDVPPEGLFQGNLRSPILDAHALGFRPGAPVPTLQTDCEDGVDFHFIDRATAMFALDNMIYTIRRR